MKTNTTQIEHEVEDVELVEVQVVRMIDSFNYVAADGKTVVKGTLAGLEGDAIQLHRTDNDVRGLSEKVCAEIYGLFCDGVATYPDMTPDQILDPKSGPIGMVKTAINKSLKAKGMYMPRAITQAFSDLGAAVKMGVDLETAGNYSNTRDKKSEIKAKERAENHELTMNNVIRDIKVRGKEISLANRVLDADGNVTTKGEDSPEFAAYLTHLSTALKAFTYTAPKTEEPTPDVDLGQAEAPVPVTVKGRKQRKA